MATKVSPPETQELADGEGKVMGFFEHIEELRARLIRILVSIGIGMAIALTFTNSVIEYLSQDYGQRLKLLEPTDSVVTFFRVAFMLGAVLVMPYITYQVFMFILPGLTRKEKRWVFLALPGTTALFIFGLIFTWFFLIPLYINFLKNFQGDVFEASWTAEAYITFVTTVLFWHGVAFETPVVFYVLGRMGMVTAGSMIRYWRHAIAGSSILAAIITPTVDPITMLSIMSVLLGLYVASIALVFIAARVNRRRMEVLQP